jgi:hypothetical protein
VRTLPKGGRLAGVSGGLAVYVTPSQVHVLRLSDGRDRLLAATKGVADAQITPAGVFYAAIRKPAYNGVVTFVPLGRVLRKLRNRSIIRSWSGRAGISAFSPSSRSASWRLPRS